MVVSDRSFSSRDLWATLIKKRAFISVVVIISAICGCLMGVVKEKRAQQSYLNNDVTALALQLSQSDRDIVNSMASQYITAVKQQKQLTTYSNSFLMDINPYSTSVLQMQYLYSGKISNPVSLFEDPELSDSEIETIQNLIGVDGNFSVNTLISVSSSNSIPDSFSGLAVSNAMTSLINLYDVNDGSLLINIECVLNDSQSGEQIFNILSQAYDRKLQNFLNDGEVSEIHLLNHNVLDKYSEKVASFQKNITADMEVVQKRITTIPQTTMSDSQKAYFSALIQNNQTDSAEPAVQAISKKAIIKYGIVGFAGGLILSIWVICIKYSLSNKVRVREDLDCAGIDPVIGTISNFGNKKGYFNHRIYQLSGKDVISKDYASFAIQESLKRYQSNQMMVICEPNDKKYFDDINSGNQLTGCAGNPSNDVKSFQDFLQADSVLFVAVAHKSNYFTLCKNVALCKKYGKKVVGGILVDEEK